MRNHALLLTALGSILGATAYADVVYSNMPNPVPPSVVSWAYQATQTSEFGQGVDIGSPTTLYSANILMDTWALESTYEAVGTSAGFEVPMTLNLYNVGAGDAVGALLASFNATELINWRPESDPTCVIPPGGNSAGLWRESDGCHNGVAQVVSFDLGGVAVPSQFIWGVTFNTTNYGPNPLGGLGGPYDSLNVGLVGTPTTGSDLLADSAYMNSKNGGNYADGGIGGTGTFRLDQNGWAGQDPGASFSTPEPMSLGMIGVGMLGMAIFARRRAK